MYRYTSQLLLVTALLCGFSVPMSAAGRTSQRAQTRRQSSHPPRINEELIFGNRPNTANPISSPAIQSQPQSDEKRPANGGLQRSTKQKPRQDNTNINRQQRPDNSNRPTMSNRLRQSPIERPGSSGKFPRFNVKPSQQSDNDTTKPNLKPSQQSDNKKPNTTVTPYRTWRRPDGNNTRPPRPERPYIKPPGSSDKNKPAAAVKPRPAWRKPGDNSTRPPGSSLKPPGTSDKNKPTAPPNKPTWRSSSDRRPQSSQKPDYKRPSKPSRAARRGSMRHHHHRPLPHKRRHYYSSWRPYWYYSYFLPRYPRVYYESWYVLRTPAYYLVPDLPEQFRLSTTVGSIVEFELEENVDSGYIWFASYDDYFCQIDIEHLRVPYEPPRYMQKSNPLAAFQIEAFNSGETMLELIYANPLEYELGQEPLKKIQVFLEITEEG